MASETKLDGGAALVDGVRGGFLGPVAVPFGFPFFPSGLLPVAVLVFPV